jgi:hypothetical protein
MVQQARSWRGASSTLLPAATAAFAFIADILSDPDVAVAMLDVPVVLMAARFLAPRGGGALFFRATARTS